MSLLSLLTGSLTSQSSVDSLAKKSGLSSSVVQMLVAAAVPMLIKSLTKNASSKDGAASLLGALTQHTSTKSMAQQIDEADEEDGGKIVNHIFGDNKSDVLTQLSSETGVDADQINTVLSSMAPALMSSLSAVTTAENQQQNNAQSSNSGSGIGSLLGGLFGGESNSAASPVSGAASALSGIFGDQLGDVAGSLLGGASQSSGGGIGSLLGGLLGGGSNNSNAGSADDGSDLISSLLGGLF